MHVSEITQQAYFDNVCRKELTVQYSWYARSWSTIEQENIVSESMILKESLMDSNTLEFGGTNASTFELELFYEDADNLPISKGMEIIVHITAYPTNAPSNYVPEGIPLFHGFIDSIKKSSKLGHYKLLAKDALGMVMNLASRKFESTSGVETLQETSEGGWEYDSCGKLFAHPIRFIPSDTYFQDELTNYILNKMTTNFDMEEYYTYSRYKLGRPNGEIIHNLPEIFGKIYKDFFEFDMSFGIIGRNYDVDVAENSKIRFDMKDDGTFSGEEDVYEVPYYKSLEIEDVDRSKFIGIRFKPIEGYNETPFKWVDGFFVDKPSNWVANNNIHCTKWQNITISQNLKFIIDQPNYTLVTRGMPWIEVGRDKLLVEEITLTEPKHRRLYIMNRTLTGIQNLVDTFYLNFTVTDDGNYTYNQQDKMSALEATVRDGLNYQRNEVSNLGSSLSKDIEKLETTVVKELEERDKIEYVTELPTTFEPNTLYFLRTEET